MTANSDASATQSQAFWLFFFVGEVDGLRVDDQIFRLERHVAARDEENRLPRKK